MICGYMFSHLRPPKSKSPVYFSFFNIKSNVLPLNSLSLYLLPSLFNSCAIWSFDFPLAYSLKTIRTISACSSSMSTYLIYLSFLPAIGSLRTLYPYIKVPPQNVPFDTLVSMPCITRLDRSRLNFSSRHSSIISYNSPPSSFAMFSVADKTLTPYFSNSDLNKTLSARFLANLFNAYTMIY
ncbi:MAG: hypothetical protein FWC00_03635 [Firmicutes bacterium]|nr:hypothetical protein [Bacillota bacterium]